MEVAQGGVRARVPPGGVECPTGRDVSTGAQGLAHSLMRLKNRS